MSGAVQQGQLLLTSTSAIFQIAKPIASIYCGWRFVDQVDCLGLIPWQVKAFVLLEIAILVVLGKALVGPTNDQRINIVKSYTVLTNP